MTTFDRITILASAVLGASGVASAATASHTGAQLLGSFALIALSHAPALLALGVARLPRLFHIPRWTLMFGALLFCADLASRYAWANGLFPMAAPLGGFAMIVGWLTLILAALWPNRSPLP